MKHLYSEKGVIPIMAIVAIAIASALFGAGIVYKLSGSAKGLILFFIGGIIFGLIILPNLKPIIRWFKDVKKEF